VVVDRSGAEEQLGGDLAVGGSFADGRGDPQLLRRQQAERVGRRAAGGLAGGPRLIAGRRAGGGRRHSFPVSGQFRIELSTGTFALKDQGDYAIWGPGIDHSWQAEEDSIIITVRWPSLVA
jgi:hypothetical protein